MGTWIFQPISTRRTAIARFSDKFVINSATGCWEWSGPKCNDGYGGFWLGGKQIGAHRAAWLLYRGEILGSHFVLHQCGNRPSLGCENAW